MDYEETLDTTMTPRTAKQKSLKGLGTYVKKRLSTKKSAKSERAAGSMDGSEDGSGSTSLKKRNTFTARLKKRFSTKEAAEIPTRRSFSAADLADLGNIGQEPTQVDDEDEVTVTDSMTQSEESMPKQGGAPGTTIRAASQPPEAESLLYPRTPVPSQDITGERLRSGDGRSSSSHHVSSGNEEIVVDDDPKALSGLVGAAHDDDVEEEQADPSSSVFSPKETTEARIVGSMPPSKNELEKEADDQQKQGIQYLGDSPKTDSRILDDVPADAAATIDVGIEEAVANSFRHRTSTEEEETTDHPLAGEEVVETVEDDEAVAKIQTRDIDLSDVTLPPQVAAESSSAVATVDPETDQSVVEKPAGKATKKRRMRRFKLKHASFSLAGLAVGLLLIIIKAKA